MAAIANIDSIEYNDRLYIMYDTKDETRQSQ